MESEGVPIYRGIGVERVQALPFKPWRRLGGKGTFIQLYGTEGSVGLLCRRNTRRRRAEGRAPYVRRNLFGGRGARHHGSMGGRLGAQASVRVANRLALFDPDERLASCGQRPVDAGGITGGDHCAEYDQPGAQQRFHLQLPLRFQRPLQRRRRFLQTERWKSCPIRCAASP